MPIPLNKKVRNYDDTLIGRLIRHVENPDSVGFIDNLWYSPKFDPRYNPKTKNYDIFNFGIGIDRKTNEYVQSKELVFHKDKQGREYLTPEEERNARNHAIANAEASYNDRLKYAQKIINSRVTPSEMKKALTISAIYNLGSKKVADNLFEDKALMDSLLNGSSMGYSNEINRYYKKYNKEDRGIKTNAFIKSVEPIEPAKSGEDPTVQKPILNTNSIIKRPDGMIIMKPSPMERRDSTCFTPAIQCLIF